MDKHQEPQETLKEIRTIMERSSRFSSLSGLTGVIAGVTAIAGVLAAYSYLGLSINEPGYYLHATNASGEIIKNFYSFFLTDALIVLVISLLASGWLTMRKAKQQGQKLWDVTSKRLFINMTIPIFVGTLYSLILLYHNHIAFVAPVTLIFYGLALINASKYTLNDIRYLGFAEVLTGLFAALLIDYGLLFWAFGFGVLHIIYGITVYFKYEK